MLISHQIKQERKQAYELNRTKQHNQKLQQAKNKLKIGNQNPFDAKLQKKQQIKQNIKQNNDQQTKEMQIRQYLNQQKQQQISEHNDAQKVYLEIMQKSKQAKKERQQIKQEVERKFQQMDQQVTDYLEQMMPTNVQKTNKLRVAFENNLDQMRSTIQGQTKIYANNANGSLEQQVQIAQQNLQKLQQKHDQEGGDDFKDDQFESLNNNIEEYNEEEYEELGEETNEIEDIADQQKEQNMSENLKNMSYILPIPESYDQFNQQLDSVLPNEELIILDRMIKSNSTFINKNNQYQVEQLAEYCLHRFNDLCQNINQLINFHPDNQIISTKLNNMLRILQYLMKEVKGYIILQFRNYLTYIINTYIIPNKQNFCDYNLVLHLRLYQLLLFQPAYDTNEQANQIVIIQNYFEILEAILNLNITNIDLIKIMLIQCIVSQQFSGVLLMSLTNNKQNQQINQMLNLYIHFWKISNEMLPQQNQQGQYQQSNNDIDIYQSENSIYYNKNINLLRKQVYSIQELDPLYMLNFNPKYSRNEAVDRVKQLAKAKSQKRHEKDKFRQQVKQIRTAMLETQNKKIEQELANKQQKIKQLEKNWNLK